MSTNHHSHTGQASVPINTPQERFGLKGMEDFYRTFKEKCFIHAKAKFDVESFKTSMEQIMKLDDRTEAFPRLTSVWKIEDKANQFQWVARVIALGKPQWAVSKGLIHRRDLKFDARMWLYLHVNINVGEITVDQFRRKAKQQPTTLPFPSLVSRLCLRVECPLWHSLDNTIQVHGVITLDTKTNKESPMIKRERYVGHMTPPSPVASSHIAKAPANARASQISPPPDLLNIAQMEKMHENQLVRLAKDIPSIIQSSLKKALQSARDKLTHLCSKVDVLESEVTILQQEVTTFTAHTDQSMPCDPEVVPPQVEAPISPPDDCWVGYHNNANIMSEEEELHHSPPPPPQMHLVYDVDPSWARGEWKQHLIMSCRPSRIDGSHQALVYLLHSH
ncbi:hypothetical protein HAX54_038638 [Datura stramonium]|uniref:Uncharacterized protein n=1 Tax=Datura stramonium TaxID=4076 RepID=A0ABS8VMV3_DATST|nr:hypothetical protein [Datura stramonium]